jgi:hypothetical protein
MRLTQNALLAFVILGQNHCSGAVRSSPAPAHCESLPRGDLSPSWDPRTLAGEYTVTWITDAKPAPVHWRDRLWLWPTSMGDSSLVQHQGPAPSDTAAHPLYGVMRPDTARFDARQVEDLKTAIDPIYPPVLLFTSPRGFKWLPDNPWAVLLIGTAGNRRDGVRILDGVGMGMRILEANSQGFRGNFGRWGIALTDSGHFCAQRARQ